MCIGAQIGDLNWVARKRMGKGRKGGVGESDAGFVWLTYAKAEECEEGDGVGGEAP